MESRLPETPSACGYHQLYRDVQRSYRLALPTRLCYGAQAGSHQSKAYCAVCAAALARTCVYPPEADDPTVEWDGALVSTRGVAGWSA
jgi:predicted amidophosphoribosyltransferase